MPQHLQGWRRSDILRFTHILAGCAIWAAAPSAQALGCEEILDRATALIGIQVALGAPEGDPLDLENGCRVKAPFFESEGSVQIIADDMVWIGEGFQTLVDEGVPPSRIELKINGLRVVPALPDPVSQYLFQEQQARSDLQFSFSAYWDDTSQTYHVREIALTFDEQNFGAVSMALTGVDITSAETFAASLGSVALSELKVDIASSWAFENYALLPLGYALLNDQSPPADQVVQIKADAVEAVEAIPETHMSNGSKVALRELIGELPHPNGRLTYIMRADPGLGAARGLALSQSPELDLTDIWSLLDGVTFEITYQPHASEE